VLTLSIIIILYYKFNFLALVARSKLISFPYSIAPVLQHSIV